MKTPKQTLFIAFILCTIALQGQNWFPISSGTTHNLNTIHFPSASVGYIGGDDSLLLKTTNGGLTWTPLNPSGLNLNPFNSDILNLQFLNDSVGYLTAGPYASTYKTTDGGLTWTVNALAGNNCYNQGLFFFDPDNGFIGGSGCFQGELISRLSNGIWSPATMNSSTWNAQNMIVDIDFFDPQHGLAASTSGLIFRTTDGGLNWDSIPSHPNMNPVTSVLMINDTLAYAGYKSLSVGFGLYISTDGGLTWAEDINSATFFYPDFLTLHQSGNGDIYTGGFSQGSQTGLIFKSPGDITTWNYDAVDQKINDISSYNDSTVFAVGDSGYIVVNKVLTGLSLIASDPAALTMDIFPNPSHDIIHLNLPTSLNAHTAVFTLIDETGRLIFKNRFQPVIDVRSLSSGKYFIEVREKNKRATGKFIVD